MKLAVMQPYLYPYLGYFQVLASVDRFVFYDDVNFIKRGWINRNRLVLDGEVRYFTVPLSGASQFSKIAEILIDQRGSWRRKICESIRQSYSRAPNFKVINEMLTETLYAEELHISRLAKQSVMAVSRYLGLETEFVMSSACYGNCHLKGEQRIIDICARERASGYYNLPGGKCLYDRALFQSYGVSLHFIQPRLAAYPQFSKEFLPGLSIIDVLMFNDKSAARELLEAEEQPV
jgi:hypothetical protein